MGDSVTLHCRFQHAVGPGLADCHVLAQRFAEEWGAGHDDTDGYLASVRDEVHILRHKWGRYTGLWRSPGGDVYVTTHDRVARLRGTWSEQQPRIICGGIWGLSDDDVWLWGASLDHDGDTLFRRDGDDWIEVPSPPALSVLRGRSPTDLVASGYQQLHRWDGATWHPLPLPGLQYVLPAWPLDETRLLVGGSQGQVGIVEAGAWRQVFQATPLLHAVAALGDVLILATGLDGLLTVRDGEIVSRQRWQAVAIEPADGGLLITCADRLAFTRDGLSYETTPIDPLIRLVSQSRPAWLPPGTPAEHVYPAPPR